MRICYLDESGDAAELPSATSSIQPAFIPAAVVFGQARIHAVTMDFLELKERFYKNLMPTTGHRLDKSRLKSRARMYDGTFDLAGRNCDDTLWGSLTIS